METQSRLLRGVLSAATLSVGLYTFAATPAAQTASCTAPPAASPSITVTVSRGDASSAADVTVAWAPVEGTNAATSYVVEAGTAQGRSDVAAIETGSTANWWVQPVAAGTYYVRVRGRNACGLGAPSWEWTGTVTASTPPGQPVARIYEPTTTFQRDAFGDLVILGDVRSAWGAGPAAFVKITARFLASNGDLLGEVESYVEGRSRQLRESRAVIDSTLARGENGCFRIASFIPRSLISSTQLSISYDALATNDMISDVRLAGPMVVERSSAGELNLSGEVINRGPRVSFWNKVVFDVRDATDKVIGCDYTYVDGTVYELPGGESTVVGLRPTQVGPFRTFTSIPYSSVGHVKTFMNFDEVELTLASELPEAVTTRSRALRRLESQPRGVGTAGDRQRLRNALNDELRAIEIGLAAD